MSDNLNGLVINGIVALTIALLVWVAYKGYRRSVGQKALELRTKLLRGFNELWVLRNGIEEILKDGNRSHLKLLSTYGMPGDKDWNLWEADFRRDQTELKQLLETAPLEPRTYEDLSLAQLEEKLVAVQYLSTRLAALRDKYTGSLLRDHDEWRTRRGQAAQRR